MRPRWSRPTDAEVMETLAVPKEQWTEGQRWAHNECAKDAAENAEMLRNLDETRKQFRHFSEGRSEPPVQRDRRLRRTRIAQRRAFEEKCNLQYLKLKKEKVSKEGERSSDTTRSNSHRNSTLAENGFMNAKWCKFYKEW